MNNDKEAGAVAAAIAIALVIYAIQKVVEAVVAFLRALLELLLQVVIVAAVAAGVAAALYGLYRLVEWLIPVLEARQSRIKAENPHFFRAVSARRRILAHLKGVLRSGGEMTHEQFRDYAARVRAGVRAAQYCDRKASEMRRLGADAPRLRSTAGRCAATLETALTRAEALHDMQADRVGRRMAEGLDGLPEALRSFAAAIDEVDACVVQVSGLATA